MTGRATAEFDLAQSGPARLRCSACAKRACETLSGLPGVGKVDCDPSGMRVSVEYDPERVADSDIISAMDAFGLEMAKQVSHAAWRVTGLD